MKPASFKTKVTAFLTFLFQPTLVLLWVGVLTYGVFIPLLNFFWDDMAIHWIADVYGSSGLAQYFSTNRPVWGWFYQINTTLLGDSPWVWQIFGLFWRWVAATGLYSLLKLIWPKQNSFALWGALLFMVNPGFGQQYIAMVYGHFFLVLSAFLYSLVFSLKAIKTSQGAIFYHIAALGLSAVNLFAMEYFFMLELLRPAVFWLADTNQHSRRSTPIRRSFKDWLPYLALFLAAVIWRFFIFDYQTQNYQPAILDQIKTQPFTAIWSLILRVLQDFWTIIFQSWGRVLVLPDFNNFGNRALWLVGGSTATVMLLLVIKSFFGPRNLNHSKSNDLKGILPILAVSLFAFLLAGIPFWLTELPINLDFPYDRFTIPFLLAFSLFWTTVLFAIPIGRTARNVIFIILIGLGTAHQVQLGVGYQRDWDQQSRMFWQFLWRAPSIEPGTVVFAHELPLKYFSDNSLTSALNWIYGDAANADSDAIPYALYYPTLRVGTQVETLLPDTAFDHDLLVGTFHGNTSQSLAIFYQPPACLRVLDPEIETDNWMVPQQVRETIHLSNTDRILAEPQINPPAELYAPEPPHNWCYYFEKADLARQLGQWDVVASLGDTAFGLDEYPNDPAERMPFIEGFAHTGRWEQAVLQTRAAAEVSPVVHPALCNLWERIDRETEPGTARDQSIAEIRLLLDCASQP